MEQEAGHVPVMLAEAIAQLHVRPGQVILDGADSADMAAAERDAVRCGDIGFVFQFHHLLPDFTAREDEVTA